MYHTNNTKKTLRKLIGRKKNIAFKKPITRSNSKLLLRSKNNLYKNIASNLLTFLLPLLLQRN